MDQKLTQILLLAEYHCSHMHTTVSGENCRGKTTYHRQTRPETKAKSKTKAKAKTKTEAKAKTESETETKTKTRSDIDPCPIHKIKCPLFMFKKHVLTLHRGFVSLILSSIRVDWSTAEFFAFLVCADTLVFLVILLVILLSRRMTRVCYFCFLSSELWQTAHSATKAIIYATGARLRICRERFAIFAWHCSMRCLVLNRPPLRWPLYTPKKVSC